MLRQSVSNQVKIANTARTCELLKTKLVEA